MSLNRCSTRPTKKKQYQHQHVGNIFPSLDLQFEYNYFLFNLCVNERLYQVAIQMFSVTFKCTLYLSKEKIYS